MQRKLLTKFETLMIKKKPPQEVGIEGTYLNILKAIKEKKKKKTTNIIFFF